MALALVGAALSVVGTVVSASAQADAASKQEAQAKKAENAREQQMQLDASHRRRQSVREALVSRANNLATGTNSNAQYGSGVQAGMGQATSMGLENQQVTNSTEILGSRVFEANRKYYEAGAKGQKAAAFGAGLGALGNAIGSVRIGGVV